MMVMPHFFCRPSAMIRPRTSAPVPGGQLTTMVIGLSIGHFADADVTVTPAKAATAAIAVTVLRIICIELVLPWPRASLVGHAGNRAGQYTMTMGGADLWQMNSALRNLTVFGYFYCVTHPGFTPDAPSKC